jgi:hypothetical protein
VPTLGVNALDPRPSVFFLNASGSPRAPPAGTPTPANALALLLAEALRRPRAPLGEPWSAKPARLSSAQFPRRLEPARPQSRD